MGSAEDKRFQIAWLSVLLMLGVAILAGYAGVGLPAAAGIFFLGTGLITLALSIAVGRAVTVITGFGVLLAGVGAVLLMLYVEVDSVLVLCLFWAQLLRPLSMLLRGNNSGVGMTDLRSKVEEDRGLLKRIQLGIPGFRGIGRRKISVLRIHFCGCRLQIC